MIRGEALRDAPVSGPFGESVPDGSWDLPIVLECLLSMQHVSVILFRVLNKGRCVPYKGKFSRCQIFAGFRDQYQSAKIKIREILSDFLTI